MLDPQQINELQKYSDRSLSKADRFKLEQKMQDDASYQKEAKTYLDVFDGFNGLAIDHLQNNMTNWEKKYSTQSVKVIPMRKKFMRYAAVAATVLFMFSLGYMGLQNSEPAGSEDLYVEYFSPVEPNIWDMTSRTGVAIDDNLGNEEVASGNVPETTTANIDAEGLKLTLSKGIDAYNSKDYKDASKYFSAYIDGTNTAQTTEVKLYLGIALLAENQAEKAEPYFKDVIKNVEFRADGEWYLALTYLRNNKIAKAKKALNKIIKQKPEHNYYAKAQALKAKMDKHNLK